MRFLLIFLSICVFLLSGCRAEQKSKEPVPGEAVIESGDAGEAELPEYDIFTPVQTSCTGTRLELAQMAIEYNRCLPFEEGGRCWMAGYPLIPGGADLRLLPPGTQAGVDSLGYVIWLYRTVLGICPPEFEEPDLLFQAAPVSAEELQTGDLGRFTESNGTAHYGVCIGFRDGLAVFSHCSGLPDQNFPCGTNRLSYLASQTDRYLDLAAPVDFTEFCRPDVTWRED